MVGDIFSKIFRILELGFKPEIVTNLACVIVTVMLNFRFAEALYYGI